MERLILGITLCTTLFSPSVSGQGSQADYERADEFRKRMSGKVFRERVDPKWIDGTPNFWYRVKTGENSHQFILVESEQARRAEAFDHAWLAVQLEEKLGAEFTPSDLPLRDVSMTGRGNALKIFFNVKGKSFQLVPAKGILAEEKTESEGNGTTVRVLPGVRPSRGTGEETEITFVNETGGKVSLFWISDPDRPTPYGELDPGERFDQHTYAGHVWLVTDEQRRTVGVYAATERPGIAVIDGSWKAGEPAGEKRKGDRGRRGGGRNDGSPQPSPSPDGKFAVVIEDHNVVLIDSSSGERSVLSEDGHVADPYLSRFFWSPDSKRLVVIQEKKAVRRKVHIVESSPKEQLQPKLMSFDYNKPGDPLDHPRPRLFDVMSRSCIPVSESLFSDPWRLSDFRWSPDSSRLTFLYNQRGHQVLRVVSVDGESGEANALIEEAPETFVCYSSKSYFRTIEPTKEILWMSERDGWNHLYLFDAESGALKHQVTKGHWVVRRVERVDEEKRQVWFQAGGIDPAQDPYHVHYCRVDFDGKNLVRLTEGDGTHTVSYSPDGEFLIDSYSRVDLAPVSELRRAGDGSLVMRLEAADASALSKVGWKMPERFTAKGRDGETDIFGVIFRPTTFDPTRKYPVIEQIYAGPHSSHVPKRFSSSHGAQVMAELGFVVVQIDGMGTSNRSKAFHDVCWRDIGDAGFPDRVKWIKAAAGSRPWMDLSRVGIFGGSAGGQNAMRALIAHHDFYHVAVADCGCHDNRMDKIWWNEQWMGYPVGEHYAASSNVDQANELQGKLMLIVGEVDRNVDPASTMQVVDALVKADKDFDLVFLPGVGHGAAGSPYGRRRQRDFFVRHLLGVEPRHGGIPES